MTQKEISNIEKLLYIMAPNSNQFHLLSLVKNSLDNSIDKLALDRVIDSIQRATEIIDKAWEELYELKLRQEDKQNGTDITDNIIDSILSNSNI
jgi:hypothetical protein